MKYKKVIIGYLLLIAGGVFVNAPFLALLAIPVFFAGVYLVIRFYYQLLDPDKPKAKVYRNLLVAGLIVFFLSVYDLVIVYSDYFSRLESSAFMNRNAPGTGEAVELPIKQFIQSAVWFLVGFILFIFALIKGCKISGRQILTLILPLLLQSVLILVIFSILARLGFPVLGG